MRSDDRLREIRPIAPIQLAEGVRPAPVGPRPRLMSMNPADLCVDASYQRDISRRSLKLIEKLVAEWDWRRYNVPVVTRVGNAWHIIDGQHTAIAALTHGGIGEIDVLVVEAEAGEDRARAFIGHNKDRVPITTTQLFFAAAAAGDADAMTALQVCERAGATILRNPTPGRPFRPGELIAVSALVSLIRRRSAMRARIVIETLVQAQVAPISAEWIVAVDTVLNEEAFRGIDADAVLATLKHYGGALQAKSAELALTRKLRRSRALAIVLHEHAGRPRNGQVDQAKSAGRDEVAA